MADSARRLVIALLAVILTACGEDKPDPKPQAAVCADAAFDSAHVHLTAPAGFRLGEDPTIDAYLIPTEQGDKLRRIGIEPFPDLSELEASDQEILLEAVTFITPDSVLFTPEGRQIVRKVRSQRSTEVTFDAQLRDGVTYTIHAQVEKVGDKRFAVMLLAPAPEQAALAEAILPTVSDGPCP